MDSDDGRNSACRAAAGPPAQGFLIPPAKVKTATRHPAGSSPVALSPVARELPFARKRAKSEEGGGAVCQDEVRGRGNFLMEVLVVRLTALARPKHGCDPGWLPFGPTGGQAKLRGRIAGRIGGASGEAGCFIRSQPQKARAPLRAWRAFGASVGALFRTLTPPKPPGRHRLLCRPLGFRRRLRPPVRRPLGMVRRPRKRHAPPRARADGRRPPPALAHARVGVGPRGSDVARL